MNLTISLTILTPILLYLLKLLHSILWRPYIIEQHFQKQGISGPGYRPITGNSPEMKQKMAEARTRKLLLTSGDDHHRGVLRRLVPSYCDWSAIYGKTYLYWIGTVPRLAISDPAVIKEVLLNSDGGRFEKVDLDPLSKQLFGNGLPELKGRKWSVHRRIAGRALNMEKVKGWVPRMGDSILKMFQNWEEGKQDEKCEFQIDVHNEFHDLSADIISRTIFGSSFEQGKRIFQLQEQQMHHFHASMFNTYIPGFRFLPTKTNIERWRASKEINESLRKLIEASVGRGGEMSCRNLLSLMMSPQRNPDGKVEKLEVEEIIEECKAFYFVGKETCANVLTWAIVLLAMNQDWQIKARQEVIQVCTEPDSIPTSENVSSYKLISMIMNETLRLYPPVTTIRRRVCGDVNVGGLQVPANTQIALSVITSHYDPGVWGRDSDRFDPDRFSQPGKYLSAFYPWGFGPRICAGQSFATIELKLALAMILKRYSFRLSETYVHSPMQFVTVQPQYGAHIMFHEIEH